MNRNKAKMARLTHKVALIAGSAARQRASEAEPFPRKKAGLLLTG
jgi:hypothetical protein